MNIMIPCWATKKSGILSQISTWSPTVWGVEDALTSTNYEQIHFGTHLDKWVDFHMLGGTGSGDSITGKILSESKPTAGTGQGRRSKSIFVILTIRDNNGKHPKPNLLSPTLQGLARHLSTVATAYINLKIFLSDSIHMLYFD